MRVREGVRMEAEVIGMPPEEGSTSCGMQAAPGNRFCREPPRDKLYQYLDIRYS